MAVGLGSATTDLAPRHAFFDFVSCLQSRQTVVEKLEAVEDLRVTIDVDQDPSQSASLGNVKHIVRCFERIELLPKPGAKVFGCYNSSHSLSIRPTVGFANSWLADRY